MAPDQSKERARRDIIRLSHAGLEGQALLRETLARLRRVVPLEAFWAATTDPATVLFTGSVGEGIPRELVARVFAEQYAPRLRSDTPLGADGRLIPAPAASA